MGQQPWNTYSQDFSGYPGLHENDQVELIQTDATISIRKVTPAKHKTLEERLIEFYGKPVEKIDGIAETECDWGKKSGDEVW